MHLFRRPRPIRPLALLLVMGPVSLHPAQPFASADHNELDELWVGGWSTSNVLRLDAATWTSLGLFVTNGSGGLAQAHHFSFGPDNNFYVASWGTHDVLRYDGRTGAFTDVFVDRGNGIVNAHSAWWLPDDTVLVAADNGDLVNRYDATGVFLSAFVAQGEGGLEGPEYFVRGADGFLYLSAHNSRILRLNPRGGVESLFVWNDPQLPGDETGGLTWAHGIDFGPDGNLYVASSQDNAVYRYDGTSGAFIDHFVTPGLGGLSFPLGLTFGPDDHLYVASFNNSRILKYDGSTGGFLATVASVSGMGVTGPTHIQFMPGPHCEADLNCDGVVSTLDLLELLGDWGPCDLPPAPCRADLDGDLVVGTTDLLELLKSWG